MLRRLALLAMLFSVLTVAVKAEDIFALTSDGKLIRFDSTAPATVLASVTITGLQAGDSLVGIDFRPATGQLVGLGANSRVYVINVATGVATAVGTASFSGPALSGSKFGIDFNPTVDRLRVVSSDTAQNIRLNTNDGTNAGTDTVLAYATFDVNTGKTPKVSGVAYTNNFTGSSSTTLYGIDAAQGVLVTHGTLNSTVSPNTGTLFTVGSLGVTVKDDLGFDISGSTSIAYAALTPSNASASQLYQINLNTGSATPVGAIGSSITVLDLAVTAPVFAYDMVGLVNGGGSLVRFMASNPAIVSNAVPVSGLAAGEVLVGIDFRPADNKLYGVAKNGTAGRIYTIDPVTGVATAVSSTAPAITLNGANFGVDFNPAADRLRVTSNTDENLRINPNDGTLVLADGTLAFATGDVNFGANPDVVASAYANNSAGVTTTTLYNIDATLNQLVLQSPPNPGTLVTIGNLGVNVGDTTGFDITSNGNFVCANANLYRISLTTGALTQVGTTAIGAGNVVDIAAVIAASPSIVQFSAATYSVVEGSQATITLTRTGSGAASVFVTTSGNVASTATSGVDFVPFGQTVSFADGETSKTILISALTDTTLELFETVQLVITNPVGAAIGTQGTATLTIVDFDDRDGDGFTTAEELAAGTSDNDASSTPFGGAPAGAANTTDLTITKAQVKLNFTKAASDQIAFSGTITNFTDANFTALSGTKAVVNFGGVIKSVTLTAKGSSDKKLDKNNSVVIKKPKNNVTTFQVKLSKGDFDQFLTDEGLADNVDSPTKAARTVSVRLLVAGKRYEETQALIVTIKAGKSSSATAPKFR